MLTKVNKTSCLQNGLASSLPYALNCILANVFARTGDYMIRNKTVSITSVRKIMSTIGMISMVIKLDHISA